MKMNDELDLPNYATKSDLKSTGVDKSDFAKKFHLGSLQ